MRVSPATRADLAACRHPGAKSVADVLDAPDWPKEAPYEPQDFTRQVRHLPLAHRIDSPPVSLLPTSGAC